MCLIIPVDNDDRSRSDRRDRPAASSSPSEPSDVSQRSRSDRRVRTPAADVSSTANTEYTAYTGEEVSRSRTDRRAGDNDTVIDFLDEDSGGEEYDPTFAEYSHSRAMPKRHVAPLRCASQYDEFVKATASSVDRDRQDLAVQVMKRSLQGIAYFGTSYFYWFLEVCSGTAILTQAMRFVGLTTMDPIDLLTG